jgi:hypothetical protein
MFDLSPADTLSTARASIRVGTLAAAAGAAGLLAVGDTPLVVTLLAVGAGLATVVPLLASLFVVLGGD